MIDVYITVAEEDVGGPVRRVLTKKVRWTTPPQEGKVIFAGETEAGERAGLNAQVDRVQYDCSGSIVVEASILHTREGFAAVIKDLLRDGFK